MSDFSDIANGLRTIVAGVPGTANVYATRKWNAAWDKFQEQATVTLSPDTEPRVNIWMVTREAVTSEPGDAFGQVIKNHRMVIIGAMGFEDDDDTYTDFQDIIDLVLAALHTLDNLSLGDVTLYSVGPASARTIAEEMLGSVFCNVAEIEVEVRTVYTVTYS